ncbi:MAG: hypothetical protein J6C13_01980 [Clostridia bacterium]|nr:hypothetical protein [Clostridia bacterium]
MKSINLKLKTIKQGNETKYLLKGFGDYILYQIFRLTDRPVLPKSALLEYYDAVKKTLKENGFIYDTILEYISDETKENLIETETVYVLNPILYTNLFTLEIPETLEILPEVFVQAITKQENLAILSLADRMDYNARYSKMIINDEDMQEILLYLLEIGDKRLVKEVVEAEALQFEEAFNEIYKSTFLKVFELNREMPDFEQKREEIVTKMGLLAPFIMFDSVLADRRHPILCSEDCQNFGSVNEMIEETLKLHKNNQKIPQSNILKGFLIPEPQQQTATQLDEFEEQLMDLKFAQKTPKNNLEVVPIRDAQKDAEIAKIKQSSNPLVHTAPYQVLENQEYKTIQENLEETKKYSLEELAQQGTQNTQQLNEQAQKQGITKVEWLLKK